MWLPIEDDSWKWEVYCGNCECAFKPRGRYVIVRKSQRYDLDKMLTKLELLASYWNGHTKYAPYEKIQVNLDEWEKWIKKNKLT